MRMALPYYQIRHRPFDNPDQRGVECVYVVGLARWSWIAFQISRWWPDQLSLNRPRGINHLDIMLYNRTKVVYPWICPNLHH